MSKALISILFSLAACGGKSTPAPTTSGGGGGGGGGAGAANAQAACVDVMAKNRECTNDFIPALVDVRAKYNNPEGITEAVKADRQQVISKALAEWAVDSQDAAIARTCEKMAVESPANDADAVTAKECLAKTLCTEYVACIMPQFEKRFAK